MDEGRAGKDGSLSHSNASVCMRILLTVHQFFPQFSFGTEVLTRSVARELIARGHEVHVLTGHPADKDMLDEERFDEYDFEGIHVYRFHHDYSPLAGQTSKLELDYDNRTAASYFARILAEFKPDVVHFFHLSRLGTGLIELAVQARVPAFITPTDFWAICPTGVLVLCDGSICRGPSAYAGNCVKHFAQIIQPVGGGIAAKWLPTAWADQLVRLTQAGALPSYPHRPEVQAISSRLSTNIARLNQLRGILSPNRLMTELLVRHGVSPQLITQSTFGIDVTENEPNFSRPPPRQPFRIGFVGSLVQHKGCHILIDAFKTLPAGRATLKIYGDMQGFPEYSAKLKLLAGDHSAIEFCGVFPNSKISEVMADLDALVVPSLWFENTPLVVYSAQASFCPVVASDFPGLSEVIRNEVNGLLFEAGNMAALATQLSRLIDEPGLAVRLSANAQRPKSIAIYVDELLSVWEAA